MKFEELRDKLAEGGSFDPTYGQCNRGGLDLSDAVYDVDPEDLILEDLMEEIKIISERS